MAMERVTIEYGGNTFTLDVPEGTPDSEIMAKFDKQNAEKVNKKEAKKEEDNGMIDYFGKPVAAVQTALETVGHIATHPLGATALGGGALYKYGPAFAEKIGDAFRGIKPAVPNAGPQLPVAGTPEGTFQQLRGAPVQPQPQPSIMQRGMDMASKMRQIAASRVLPAAGAAGPFAVSAAVPGAMMAHDYQSFKQLTPEQQQEQAMQALSGQAPGQAW